MVGIIEKSSISGLDSLVTYIDNDRFLTPEEKLKLKNIIETKKQTPT